MWPPAGRRGRRPLRQNRKIPPNFVGAGALTRPLWVLSSRRGGYQPPEAFPLGGRWHGEAVTDEGAIEKTSR